MPAKLRMNVIANPGIDKADFELFSLAVSAQNGGDGSSGILYGFELIILAKDTDLKQEE